MSLAEYQRGVLRASLALAPAEGEYAQLGDPDRFRLYRRMVRSRLREMAGVAFKHSLAAFGAGTFDACFEDYLEREPPRSPYIREVVADFGQFARAALRSGTGPGHLSDLLRFEETKWRVAYAPARMPEPGEDGVRELDFEGSPVLNPTLSLLRLEHAVHTLPETPPVPGPLSLFVYRPPARDDVRWYAADPLLAGIVTGARESSDSLAQLVRRAAEELGLALDAALLESLASSLTLALSRGVVIGVR